MRRSTQEVYISDNDTLRLDEAITAFGRLLAAIPKSKRALTVRDAMMVEGWMNQAARVMDAIRQYCLETPAMGGEHSPFAHRISKLIRPRLEVEDPPQ